MDNTQIQAIYLDFLVNPGSLYILQEPHTFLASAHASNGIKTKAVASPACPFLHISSCSWPWHKPFISAQTALPTTPLPIYLQYSGQCKTACNPNQPSQELPRCSGAQIQLLTITWMWACWAQDTADGCAPRWPMQQEPQRSRRSRNSSSPSKTKLGQDWGAGRGQLVLFQIGMWYVMEPMLIQKAHKQKQKVP